MTQTALATVLLILLTACEIKAGYNTNNNLVTKPYTVYVIQSRWHTGIVFYTRDVNEEYWPEIKGLRNRKHVEVGWGDEKFYQAYNNLILLGIRAMLWPTPSVLQVHGFNREVSQSYGDNARILEIPLTAEAHDALVQFVGSSYLRDEHSRSRTSTAFGETNLFYLATRDYHLFQTCNTWVAMGFRQAGKDVRSFGVLNANQLFRQLSRIEGTAFK